MEENTFVVVHLWPDDPVATIMPAVFLRQSDAEHYAQTWLADFGERGHRYIVASANSVSVKAYDDQWRFSEAEETERGGRE